MIMIPGIAMVSNTAVECVSRSILFACWTLNASNDDIPGHGNHRVLEATNPVICYRLFAIAGFRLLLGRIWW